MVNKEIVIAAYDKPLNWLSELNDNIKKTIYRKGNIIPISKNEILLEPNFGRCVHTFFKHITTNYNTLSDLTFFVQDYPFDHWENLIEVINGNVEEIKNYSTLNISGYNGFHFNTIKIPSQKGGIMHTMYSSEHHGNGKIIHCQSNGLPHDNNPNINVDIYWDMLFDEPKPSRYEFIPGGHFSITKEHVNIRTLQFYKTITELLEESVHAPWVFERLECYIFNPKYKTKF